MAKPKDDSAGEIPLATVNCPRCGARVTAEPAFAGDKGVLFRCSNCGKMFGIVPGISEDEQARSDPPEGAPPRP
jgi:DNA-directed RNA polymerase subunit RPC12/RpoP